MEHRTLNSELTIVIATCGRPERLRRCLECCRVAAARAGGIARLIVADNGPRREACETVGAVRGDWPWPVAYLETPPRDKCAALNAALRRVPDGWVAFTDDDTEPDPDWLLAAQRFRATSPCRVFGGRVKPGPFELPKPPWLVPGRSGRLPGGSVLVTYDPRSDSGILPGDAPVPFGANLFVARSVFTDHGGYDERLWSLCGKAALGVDDGEFGVRIQARGEPLGYCREALVVHPVRYDRRGVWSHMLVNYLYGWRDPMVFFDSRRPLWERWRLRCLVSCLARLPRDLARRDAAGVVDDLSMGARHLGAIRGRMSRAYVERLRLAQESPGKGLDAGPDGADGRSVSK